MYIHTWSHVCITASCLILILKSLILKCTVKVDTKLGRQNSQCKQLQCIVGCYLASMLLLKCVDDLIILVLILNYSQIIPD